MASSDAELIAESLRDPRVFAGVFDRYYAAVAGFLRRRLERSLADELAAETFLRAFDGRCRYDVSRANAGRGCLGSLAICSLATVVMRSGGCGRSPVPGGCWMRSRGLMMLMGALTRQASA